MTRRQELVLAVVGALLVLVAATLLLIRPTRQATAEARADRDTAVAESQTLRDQIKALEALKPKEAELKAQAELAKAEFPATPGSPGAGSPVATITFGGAGLEHVDVGGFLRALARGPKKGGQQVYLNPYFTTSQKADESGQQTVTFSATVDLSSAAYSGRFQPAGTVTP